MGSINICSNEAVIGPFGILRVYAHFFLAVIHRMSIYLLDKPVDEAL